MVDLENIEIDALLKSNYESIINQCEPNIHSYGEAFSKASEVAIEDGDLITSHALKLLSFACSPSLDSASIQEPFRAAITWEGRRTVIPSDFSKNQGYLFANFAKHVSDPELASRIGDLAWLLVRDQLCANIAIENYVRASDTSYCLKNWRERVKRLERALRLSFLINNTDQVFFVKRKLTESLNTDNEYYNLSASKDICEILLDSKENPIFVAEKAHSFAIECGKKHLYEMESSFFYISVDGFRKAGDHTRANDALIQSAEALIKRANVEKNLGKMIVAGHFLKDAIQVLQKCKGQKARIVDLQKELFDVTKASFKEMQHISLPAIDISEIVQRAISEIRNKEFPHNLINFAYISRPLSLERLKENILEKAKAHPFLFSVGRNLYNREGKIIALVPPLLHSQGEKYESALLAACYEEAKLRYTFIVQGVIIPVRDEILRNCQIDESVLFQILQHCDFLPSERLVFWIKGLLAGFNGDFDIALSLLIPQFEYALRKKLELMGGMVWNVDPGTQFHSEKLLRELFELKAAFELLGQDLLFELKGLLIERTGENIRNNLSHGLMSEQDFYSSSAIYLWWLFFHICLCLRGKP